MTTLGDFTATAIDGTEADLAAYEGQVVLVVNTASQCGFTPQYEGLQQLQEAYADRGFTVLGFPCDQFGGQEPGTEDEIAAFCERSFGVGFPLFAKVDVNGDGAHPLFTWLRGEKSGVLGGRIKWNFTKFLLARDGTVVDRFAPTTKPERLAAHIERVL
jgi:glutathione peroxidase